MKLRAVGDVDAGRFRTLLQSLRVRLEGEARITVVVTDSYLRGDLRTFNDDALRGGRPWLLVKPVGWQVWLGPLCLPGKTVC